MRAIQYTGFGGSGVLREADLKKPEPREHELLVKVIATTVNPLDVKIRKGSMQKTMPVQMPFVPGSDLSGIVEAVGSSVKGFKPGDEIFATASGGTYAEYAVVSEQRTAHKSSKVPHEEAAALAVPLSTAFTVLTEAAGLQKGQRILIHGASGAVGSVMTQLAKHLGAYVIATAPASGIKLVKDLGADEVIDYKEQDFTKLVSDMDLVVDPVGGDTQARSFEVLKKGGKLLSIVSPPSEELAEKYGVGVQFVMGNPTTEKLERGMRLAEEGTVNVRVARVMTLEQAAKAQDLLSEGGLNGKIVLRVNR